RLLVVTQFYHQDQVKYHNQPYFHKLSFQFTMKTAIVGAGLMGLTTAYYLSEAPQAPGSSITIVEKRSAPASATTHPNPAPLTPFYYCPNHFPAFFAYLLRAFARAELRVKLSWDLIKWGASFLGNCTFHAFQHGTCQLYTLGVYSQDLTLQLTRSWYFRDLHL